MSFNPSIPTLGTPQPSPETVDDFAARKKAWSDAYAAASREFDKNSAEISDQTRLATVRMNEAVAAHIAGAKKEDQVTGLTKPRYSTGEEPLPGDRIRHRNGSDTIVRNLTGDGRLLMGFVAMSPAGYSLVRRGEVEPEKKRAPWLSEMAGGVKMTVFDAETWQALGKDRNGRDVRKGDRVRIADGHGLPDSETGPFIVVGARAGMNGVVFLRDQKSDTGACDWAAELVDSVPPLTTKEALEKISFRGVKSPGHLEPADMSKPVMRPGDSFVYTFAYRDGSQRTYATREEYERDYGVNAPGAGLFPLGVTAIPYPLPQPEKPTLAAFTARVTAKVREMAPDASITCNAGMVHPGYGTERKKGFFARVRFSHGIEFTFERDEGRCRGDGFDEDLEDDVSEALLELGARVMGKK